MQPMQRSARARGALVGLVLACSACDDAAGGPPVSQAVFDLDVVHRIEITVEERHMEQLADDRDNRVPCGIVVDGVPVAGAGIRQKGGIGSVSSLDEKPGFSVRFDEFDAGLRLRGRRKLILNNAKQDPGFLDEHLGYEIYRRAGLPAPRTAHGVVTLNGESYGLYVVKEAIDEQFLERVFGSGAGNLYEGPDRPHDFVDDVERMDLKRETKQARTREDLHALVDLVRETPHEDWVEVVGGALDLDGAIAGYAVDAVVDHWDGYAFNANNYYLYNDPFSRRFVFLPHGMDQLFDDTRHDVMSRPDGELMRRIREHAELEARYVEQLARVRDQAFDVEALVARSERVAEILRVFREAEGELPEAVERDIDRFERNLGELHDALRERREQLDRAPVLASP